MQLPEVEALLRERLAGTLPGPDAQVRFVPVPATRGWRAGEFPEDARVAAALLCLYPHEQGVAIPLTVRATTLARHAGQVSLPGGAKDPGETLVRRRCAKPPKRSVSTRRRCACSAS